MLMSLGFYTVLLKWMTTFIMINTKDDKDDSPAGCPGEALEVDVHLCPP